MNTSAAEIRTLLDALMQRRAPLDDREQQSLDRFRAELDRLHDPCSETADTTHVTSSVIIVGPRGVVLHKHKRLGIWLQPGGHIDPGELPWDAAVREVAEETGLTATHAAGAPQLIHVDVHPGPRGHTHLDLRYLLAAEGHPDPGEGESQDVAWFGWETAIEMTDAGVTGLLAALAPADASTVVIRPARADDGGALAELYLRSRAHALPGLRSPHTDDETRIWLCDHLLRTAEVWVAEVAGVRVGLLARSGHWIEQLYIDPAWIGRGIGAQLLARARDLSPSQLELWTFERNDRARRFYERHGFREVERTDGRANEEREPDVRMLWTPT